MINPSQCRGARALLGITQQQLADLAGISKRTVIEFEGGIRVPLTSTSRSLQWALENAGIAFLRGDGGGSGVRFRDSDVEEALMPRTVSRQQVLNTPGLMLGNALGDRPPESGVPANIYEATELSLAEFQQYSSPEQRQALELFRAGLDDVPHEVARRATMTRMDGTQTVMDWQGPGIQLFPKRVNLAGKPLAELPDAKYGRWVEGRTQRVQQSGEPLFELCHGMVEVDGNRTVWRYYSLRLPRVDGRTLTITSRA